jgi:hypothetical protein
MRFVRVAGGAVAGLAAALTLGSVGALAYPSGSLGYDISYLNCGAPYPTNVRPGPPPQVRVPLPAHVGRAEVPVPLPQSPSGTAFRTPLPFVKTGPGFGIVGVNSGYPFMSAAHPGNPCLLHEYNHTPMASLYVNTGYDPIYTDANHTTTDCTAQSASVAGSTSQQAAWAVGCSEAQGDYAYASSNGITTPVGWWLDVETANSWCGQSGTNCTDLTLNQYTIQGIIDELTHIGAVPVGIYSNNFLWSAIVGTNTVHGAASDWYASGTSTSQSAAAYCTSSYSFSGAPVSLVQYLNGSVDRDYAC